jgi:hypothetical protein
VAVFQFDDLQLRSHVENNWTAIFNLGDHIPQAAASSTAAASNNFCENLEIEPITRR